MKISIITICMNEAENISKTLESIYSQTYNDIESIIIDGGSTDGTQEIVNTYNPNYFISEPDSGIYDAMNKGIKAANGDIICFLNAGDSFYSPDVIEQVVRYFKKYKVAIIYGDVYFDINDDVKKDDLLVNPYQVCRMNNFSFNVDLINRSLAHASIFYNYSLFTKYGNYSDKYPISADHDLNTRFLIKHKVKIKYINKILSTFYLGGISTLKKHKDKNNKELKSIISKHNCLNYANYNKLLTFKRYYKKIAPIYFRPIYRYYTKKFTCKCIIQSIIDKVIGLFVGGALNKIYSEDDFS